MLTASGDETLMEQLQVGRVDALAVLFNRYRRLVFTVANSILRDSAEAEDLTQDVFIEICRKAQLYDSAKGSVKTWVLQYAYHRSFNRRRYLSLRHSHYVSARNHYYRGLKKLKRRLVVKNTQSSDFTAT